MCIDEAVCDIGRCQWSWKIHAFLHSTLTWKNRASFSQETTLCGKSILNNIQKAKRLGYSIELHYVGLDSADTAKQRVKNRVMQGGHGIPDEDIERRYVETLENLKIVLPLCDVAAIYDNTEKFRRFAIYKEGKCVRVSSRVPEWFHKIE
jgi:predicted ABC-type ATPase